MKAAQRVFLWARARRRNKLNPQQELLNQAIIWAVQEHEGELDRGGDLQILHPMAVMQAVAPDLDAMTVAILHDVFEDTEASLEALEERGYPKHIVRALELITREPAETPNRRTYKQYIEDLSQDPLARKVKIADTLHNMSDERLNKLAPEERGIKRRYEKALHQMLDTLEAEEVVEVASTT